MKLKSEEVCVGIYVSRGSSLGIAIKQAVKTSLPSSLAAGEEMEPQCR